MRDKDTSAVREMFQYSSLAEKPFDQWEIATLWRPHHCDPHLDQTKLNNLLPLTIDGDLAIECSASKLKWPPCRLPIAGGHNLRLLGLGPGQVQGGRSLNIHQLSLQQSFSPSSCPWFIPGLPWQRKTGRNSLPHLLPTHGRWWPWFWW